MLFLYSILFFIKELKQYTVKAILVKDAVVSVHDKNALWRQLRRYTGVILCFWSSI